MSRYPGSQFIVIDNTATTATVPIAAKNPAAPTYMTTFSSVKGPEEIRTVYGNEFYDLYGSQANVMFSKYGQPLLQASMNINAGAQLICKRAVLEDAKLANATLAAVLTKTTDSKPTLTLDEDGHITSFTIPYTINSVVNDVPVLSPTNFTIRPVVISVEDDTSTPTANIEGKEYYNIHKSSIITKILGGSEVDGYNIGTGTTVVGTYPLEANQTVAKTKTFNLKASNSLANGFNEVTIDWDLPSNATAEDNTDSFELDSAASSFASVFKKKSSVTTLTDETDSEALALIYSKLYKEYVFPLFTIFDNGRGISTKSLAFAFDVATSKTLSKAVYTLKVIDYATNKTLESMAFTIDPYTRNNNTGYTFDIESAVNFKSKQVKAIMHYDSYEKLLAVLTDAVHTDEHLFINTDCLFNHDLKGNNLTNGKIINNLYVNTAVTANNLDSLDEEVDTIAYYYYDYVKRYRQGLSEKLFFGDDGTLSYQFGDSINSEITLETVIKTTDQGVDTTPYYEYYATAEATTTTKLNTYNAASTQYYQVVNNPLGTTPVDKVKIEKYDSKGNRIVITKFARVNSNPTSANIVYSVYTVTTTYTWNNLYQDQYRKFFNGAFDKDIFNLDVYFPQCIWDCNYNNPVKLAIQKLSAYRGDLLAYLDMGIGKVNNYSDAINLIPTSIDEEEFPISEYDATYFYVRDMHNAVTCISYDIRDPYTNKQISVTGTYGLSIAMINHYITGVGKVFAGKSNGVTFGDAIESTINYIPKIYPTSAMTTLNNIGMTYPSDDSSIMNEKQIMCDARINYGSYYDGLFVMDTEYTMNYTESEFSYINNVMLVNDLIQSIRRECPSARYNFIDGEDLETYEKAVNTVINAKRSNFASVKFKYLQDENSIANKIFYAALEIVFRPFAQAEIFTITALNYSTLDSNITTA